MKLARSARGSGRIGVRGCIALLLLLVFSACLPEPPPVPTPEPTATATITPTITATVIWFPATPTFTAVPTRPVEPTLDARPVLGDLLFEDPFTDTALWLTSRSAAGSVAYGREELTLAVSQSKGSLLSLRKSPQMNNFYLEVDAQPSLCRANDAYGLLLRSASAQDYYRLAINCSGQLRMERVKNSRMLPIYDWTTSGQLQPGGMLRSRLGIAAQGPELRVFIDGVYQFSVKDPVFASGVVGVFARAAGDTPLTVSFSKMTAYSLAPAQPQRATVTPAPSMPATPTR